MANTWDPATSYEQERSISSTFVAKQFEVSLLVIESTAFVNNQAGSGRSTLAERRRYYKMKAFCRIFNRPQSFRIVFKCQLLFSTKQKF